MYRSTHVARSTDYRQSLLDVIKLWLALGSLLLLTGLLPVHSALLGWSAPFWLLITPPGLMALVAPELPRQWLHRHRPRRLTVRERIWN